jgi:hypothetical protein
MAEGGADSQGRLIFVGLLILLGGIVLWYSAGAGTMGIEERFSSALGTGNDGVSPEGGEGTGFSLEGQPVAYVLVLVILGGLCWMAYRKFGT